MDQISGGEERVSLLKDRNLAIYCCIVRIEGSFASFPSCCPLLRLSPSLPDLYSTVRERKLHHRFEHIRDQQILIQNLSQHGIRRFVRLVVRWMRMPITPCLLALGRVDWIDMLEWVS